MNTMNLNSHEEETTVQYRGFLLLKQHNQTWLIRPIRSPMIILPFRTSICSLSQAKNFLDQKLYEENKVVHI